VAKGKLSLSNIRGLQLWMGNLGNIAGFINNISFVGNVLSKSPVEQYIGSSRLTMRFCRGLENFNVDGPNPSKAGKNYSEE
jgi:hypothetical protein